MACRYSKHNAHQAAALLPLLQQGVGGQALRLGLQHQHQKVARESRLQEPRQVQPGKHGRHSPGHCAHRAASPVYKDGQVQMALALSMASQHREELRRGDWACGTMTCCPLMGHEETQKLKRYELLLMGKRNGPSGTDVQKSSSSMDSERSYILMAGLRSSFRTEMRRSCALMV